MISKSLQIIQKSLNEYFKTINSDKYFDSDPAIIRNISDDLLISSQNIIVSFISFIGNQSDKKNSFSILVSSIFPKDYEKGIIHLEKTVNFFSNNPLFSHKKDIELSVKVTQYNPNYEEMFNIWSIMGGKHFPFAIYHIDVDQVSQSVSNQVSVKTGKVEFCNNDRSLYKIEITPQNGLLKTKPDEANSAIVFSNGQYFFNPSNIILKSKEMKIDLLVNDKDSKVSLKVFKNIQIKIKLVIDNKQNEFEVKFTNETILDSDMKDLVFVWDFGDGKKEETIGTKGVLHSFSKNLKKSNIKISLKDWSCFTTFEQEIIF